MMSDTSKEASEQAPAGDKIEGESATANAQDLTAELQNKLQEAEKKYLYLYSEFENFRRRTERDRLDFIKFGHEGFLKELLQVVDNFDRALTHSKELNPEKGSPLALVNQGIEMIHFQLMECLKGQGVTKIKAVGVKFDPSFHEAVGEEEAADVEPGVVLKEVQNGYLLHGRLLRAARVLIAKK